MSINVEELILAARDILTEEPESAEYSRDALLGLVKPAIVAWQDQTNQDVQKRQNFVVQSAAITITNGIADLSTEIDSKGFRIEFIKDSDIEVAISGVSPISPEILVKLVSTKDRLNYRGRQDKFFVVGYLSGSRITFRAPGSGAINSLNGTMTLRAPVIPSDLTAMNKPIMYELAIVIAQMAKQKYERPQAA